MSQSEMAISAILFVDALYTLILKQPPWTFVEGGFLRTLYGERR